MKCRFKNKFFIMLILLVFAVTAIIGLSGCKSESVSVSLDKDSLPLKTGESIKINAEVSGINDYQILWQSADEAVATVNEDGYITGVSKGETNITASVENSKAKASCLVTVTDQIELSLTGQSFMYIGSSIDLFVSLIINGEAAVAENIEFSVVSGLENVTLNQNTVTGVSEGTSVIKAVHREYNYLSAEYTVKVSEIVNLRFSEKRVVFTTYDLASQKTVLLDFQASKGDNALSAADITWNSLDLSVASVDEGLVTFKKGGEVVISATYGNVTENCVVICRSYEGCTPIYTASDLKAVSADLSGKYVLMNDINLNSDGQTGLNFLISLDAFTGTFEGNGKTIYGYSNTSGAWSLGIFFKLEGTVRDLTVLADTYHTGNSCGVLAGTVQLGGVIDNAYVYANRIIKDASTAAYGSGLLAGLNFGGTILNSVAAGNYDAVASGDNVGKFYHITNSIMNSGVAPVVKNCYSIINNAPSDMIVPIAFGGVRSLTPGYTKLFIVEVQNAISAGTNRLGDYYVSYEIEDQAKAEMLEGNIIGLQEGGTKLIISFADANGTVIGANDTAAYLEIQVNIVNSLPPPTNLKTQGTNLSWDAVLGARGYELSVQYEQQTAQLFAIRDASVLNYNLAELMTDGGVYRIKIRTLSSGEFSQEYVLNAIKTRAQFAAIGESTDSLSGNYVLIDNIDLNNGGSGINFFISLEAFTGVFDGNGKTIYGYSNTSGTWGQGIFFKLEGTVRNITVLADTYHTGNSSGVLAGTVQLGGVIDNAYVYANRIIKDASTAAYGSGLVAGLNYGGTILNSVAAGNYDAIASGNNIAKFVHISNTVTNNGVLPVIKNCYSIINNGPSPILVPGVGQVTVFIPLFDEVTVAAGGSSSLDFELEGKTLIYSIEPNEYASLSSDGKRVIGLSAGTAMLRIAIAGIEANGTAAYLEVPITIE